MPGESVGNAYLNVVPKVDADGNDLGSAFGDSFKGGVLGKLDVLKVAAASILADLGTQAISSVGEVFNKMFTNFGDYEQLVGGVETLFGAGGRSVEEYAASVGKSVADIQGEYDKLMSSQDAVLQNAKQAFMSSGLSANEYMETVTSFSAALISSLDGDTAKAAQVADKAIIDMSDNANKMGSSMESIQNAYQSFAKQNYTMLDNLKLGYGGTKSEMERLLADASKLAGVEFNIDSYSDVIEAIHVIQESMDITGTTAKEGASTISGSISMLSAAWDNFLTAFGDGGRTLDFSVVTQNLLESVSAVAKNAIPTIVRIAGSAITQLPGILAQFMNQMPSIVGGALLEAFGAGDGGISDILRNAFGDGVATAFDGLVDRISGPISRIKGAFETFKASIDRVLGNAFKDFGQIITNDIGGPVDIAIGLMDGFGSIVEQTLGSFAGLLSQSLPQVVGFFKNIIGSAIDVSSTFMDRVMPTVEIMGKAFEIHVGRAVASLGEIFTNTLMPALGGLSDFISNTVMPGIGSFAALLAENFLSAVVQLAQFVSEVVVPVIGELTAFFVENLMPHVAEFATTVGEVLLSALSAASAFIIDTVIPAITDLSAWFLENLVPAFQAVGDWILEILVPAFQSFAGFITDNVIPVLATIGSFIIENVVPIFGTLAGFVIETLVPAVGSLVGWIAERLKPVFETVAGFVIEHVVPALGDLFGSIGELMGGFGSLASKVLDVVVPALKGMWEWFSEHILPIITEIADFLIGTFGEAFTGIASILTDTVIPALSSLFGWVSDSIIPIFEGLVGVLGDVVSFLGDVANSVGGAIDAAAAFFFGGGETSNAGGTAWHAAGGIVLPNISWHATGGMVKNDVSWHGFGGMVNGATLIGAGERGSELIWPSYEPYISKYASALVSQMDNKGVEIHDCTFNVRKEEDIRSVANQLYTLMNREKAGVL